MPPISHGALSEALDAVRADAESRVWKRETETEDSGADPETEAPDPLGSTEPALLRESGSLEISLASYRAAASMWWRAVDDALRVLADARSTIEDPTTFVQGSRSVRATSQRGRAVAPDSKRAARFSLSGALTRAFWSRTGDGADTWTFPIRDPQLCLEILSGAMVEQLQAIGGPWYGHDYDPNGWPFEAWASGEGADHAAALDFIDGTSAHLEVDRDWRQTLLPRLHAAADRLSPASWEDEDGSTKSDLFEVGLALQRVLGIFEGLQEDSAEGVVAIEVDWLRDEIDAVAKAGERLDRAGDTLEACAHLMRHAARQY